MSRSSQVEDAWFAGLEHGAMADAVDRIRTGDAERPASWPTLAIEEGFVEDVSEYRTFLQEAAIAAAREAVASREGADDQQVIHAIRAIDDLDRVTNELAERVGEWARTTSLPAAHTPEAVVDLLTEEASTPMEEEILALAEEIEDLGERRTDLVTTVERVMHDIAPNLTALAGPLLGARLIALAGGLEEMAKMPSSTVQVLGAEDALFAHLRGDAPSPKHGIIFTHSHVRDTHPSERGSAARALAGKLSIAARIDHYAGDRRPSLERELNERIERIRERSS